MWIILNLYENNSRAEIAKILSGKYLKEDIKTYYDIINRWVNKFNAFFFTKINEKICSPSEKELIQYISINGFQQLTLSITEDCNLRCKYCSYSDAYFYTREHNKKRMSFSTAKKAIDYYFTMFKKVWKRNPYKRPTIGFYGGEPLLNFKLVRESIEYINSKFPEFKEKMLYTITTNGTLLTESVIDYLVSNDVSIVVSLNGDKYEHDRLRIYKDGTGTFSVVIKNLQKLKYKYPNYSKGIIQSCYDWGTDLIRVKKFFDSNRKKLPFHILNSMISSSFTNYYSRYNERDKKNFKEQIRFLHKEYFYREIKGVNYTTDYLDYLLGANYRAILIQQTIARGNLPFLPYTSTCVPGEKICVRYDGTYHICEKINHRFTIGDVEHGLNFEKIKNITTLYNRQIAANCTLCPIKRLCPACFSTFAENSAFKKDPPEYCESTIKFTKDQLSYIYSMLEENPKALNMGKGAYYKEIIEPNILF